MKVIAKPNRKKTQSLYCFTLLSFTRLILALLLHMQCFHTQAGCDGLLACSCGSASAEPLTESDLSEACREGKNRVLRQYFTTSSTADIDKLIPAYGYGNFLATPLMLAIRNGHLSTVQFLIKELGADVNTPDEEGDTPLITAIKNGYSDIVIELIESGADVNQQDGKGKPPLTHLIKQTPFFYHRYKFRLPKGKDWYPSQTAFAKCINLLIQREVTYPKPVKGAFSPLHKAAMYGIDDTVSELLRIGAPVDEVCSAKNFNTPLHLALMSYHPSTAKVLLDAGAGVNVMNTQGLSPLLYALSVDPQAQGVGGLVLKYDTLEPGKINDLLTLKNTKREHPLLAALREDNHDAIHFLIETKGVHPQQPLLNSFNQWTSGLHWAVTEGRLGTLIFLKEQYRCELDRPAFSERTPLHEAARHGHVDIIEYLLHNGVSLNATDKDDNTPLHLAAEFGNHEAVSRLIRAGADINRRNKSKDTPLHCAINNQKQFAAETIVGEFAQKGDIHGVNDRGETPLFRAAQLGYTELATLLLGYHADINEPGPDEQTPLMAAAKGGHFDTVRFLIEQRASIHDTTSSGWTPLHFAASEGVQKLFEYLVSVGGNLFLKNNVGDTPYEIARRKRLIGKKQAQLWHQQHVQQVSSPTKATAKGGEQIVEEPFIEMSKLSLSKSVESEVQDDSERDQPDYLSKGANRDWTGKTWKSTGKDKFSK